jgi:hypothetical protein
MRKAIPAGRLAACPSSAREPRPPAGQHGGWLDAPVAPRDFRDPDRLIPVSVVGAHGGAGTTTVARLLRATDLGTCWPTPADGHPPRVLLVARTHAAGLMAASKAFAGYYAAGHPEGPYLAGFVLVPDAPGRLPKPLRRRITILASATMVLVLPWVAAWRLSETAHDPKITGRLRSFAETAAMTSTPSMSEGGKTWNA